LRRVGLNLLYLVPGAVGGTEVYARRLVDALARARPQVQWVAFCGREAAAPLAAAGWPPNVRVRALEVAAASKPRRVAAELGLLPRAAAGERVQLLHSLGTTAPLHGPFTRVVTVHDLIYHHWPGSFPLPARIGLELLVPAGAWRAHGVLADSKAAKLDLVATLRLDPARIDVVHLGLGMTPSAEPTPESALRATWELGDRPVLLTVAAALPHKNLTRLLRALAALPGEPALVLVGHAGREQPRLAALAAELGLGGRVRFTGWVTDADLEGLYALARLFVYPSLHEGFGLPVLEAMRRGVPVACADATSLPEVAGDAAAYFDGADERAIAATLRRLLDDPAAASELARRGPARAAGFSWERCASETLAAYERARRTRPQ